VQATLRAQACRVGQHADRRRTGRPRRIQQRILRLALQLALQSLECLTLASAVQPARNRVHNHASAESLARRRPAHDEAIGSSGDDRLAQYQLRPRLLPWHESVCLQQPHPPYALCRPHEDLQLKVVSDRPRRIGQTE